MKPTKPTKQKPAKVRGNKALERAVKQVIKAMKPAKKPA